MNDIQSHIHTLDAFMQTEGFASLDVTTRIALQHKKGELCGLYFMQMASNLNRNKFRGCFAPHKAVMLMTIMELVREGYLTDNLVCLDKTLKERFRVVWERVVPMGSPFKCDYRNPFIYMDSEPFWQLTDNRNKAVLSWEAFCAFSHEESCIAIAELLQRSIKEDTISEQYRQTHQDMNWMVAEDFMSFVPFLGLLMAI